jgi:membrane protease subunit HflC
MNVSDSLASRNLIGWAIGAIFAVLVLSSIFAVVPETKQALVVRFGKPEKVYNAYKPNEDFGATGAGVIMKIPFVDQIHWIDKRVRDFDM